MCDVFCRIGIPVRNGWWNRYATHGLAFRAARNRSHWTGVRHRVRKVGGMWVVS